MKYAKSSRNNWHLAVIGAVLISLAVFISLAAVVLFAGCTSTVAPRPVISYQASWDGTNQNSGFLGFVGASGIITEHARDRYNGLIDIYGKKFVPPIGHDYGILPYYPAGTYSISPQALTYFSQMNRWRKSTAP